MSEEKELPSDTAAVQVHPSCLPALELLLQHGLLTLDPPHTAASQQSMLNAEGHLGVLSMSMMPASTATTTTTAETVAAESKVDEAPPLPNMISSWQAQPQQAVQFDDDGYVTLLDIGGKRLHRGYPCSIKDTIGALSTKLTTLNVAGTDLPRNDMLAILQLPHIRQHLECLYAGGNGWGDDGVMAMATEYFLSSHTHTTQTTTTNLVTLDLRFNDISGSGMTALCERLPSSVQQLYLEGNQVGDEGAAALAKLLEEQATALLQKDGDGSTSMGLREIFLGANGIGPDGAKALANSLRHNQTLSKLYLEGNHIGLEGANAFSSVLEELQQQGKNALKNLYVDNNQIGKDGSKRLAQALNSGTAIGESIM